MSRLSVLKAPWVVQERGLGGTRVFGPRSAVKANFPKALLFMQ